MQVPVDRSDTRRLARGAARRLVAASLLLPALLQACSSDSEGDRSLDGAKKQSNAGAGGTSNPHITPVGAGTGGNNVWGGTGSGATGGADDSAGAAGELGDPPGPTADGSSPYTVLCDETTPCGDDPAVSCLHILLDEGTRSTCSSDCRTTADCSDAPSGTGAEAACVAFTSAKHCVLVCYDAGVETECPAGMGCYRYLDSPIGYCLSL